MISLSLFAHALPISLPILFLLCKPLARSPLVLFPKHSQIDQRIDRHIRTVGVHDKRQFVRMYIKTARNRTQTHKLTQFYFHLENNQKMSMISTALGTALRLCAEGMHGNWAKLMQIEWNWTEILIKWTIWMEDARRLTDYRRIMEKIILIWHQLKKIYWKITVFLEKFEEFQQKNDLVICKMKVFR